MELDRLTLASNTALETGKKLLDLFHQGKQQGELKSDQTLVTGADRAADQFIQTQIRNTFPEDGILSEENSTVFPDGEHTWVVDPLDGTVNFSQGLHAWGVSIAHLKDGNPVNAAVYIPVIDELYTASLGSGAKLNGNPLKISESPDDSLFPIFVHCSRMHKLYKLKTRYQKRSLGAAAYSLCLIAKSSAVLALESTPKIWDFAASWLIIKEAGGVIQALGNHQPFPAEPGMDYLKHPYTILAAVTEEILINTLDSLEVR
ncbi:MAG: hypothetical protein MUP11_08365 [Anaerolineales bacterium]|nr:hypothetical protein [Anaerolineales bacterium]